MKTFPSKSISYGVLLLIFNCFSTTASGFFFQSQPVTPTLKDTYAEYFTIGASVGPRSLSGPDSILLSQQFSSITAENVMKMGPIHPEIDRYEWQWADAVTAFARSHHMKVRGHTLCWHNQTPDWLYKDAEGQTISKDELYQRLKEHIYTVVNRYKGDVYAWDVVNEVISDGEEFFRNSDLYKISGEEYIAKVFQFAHEADPDALLFYNDYNTINPQKREKIYQMVKTLLDKGIPIHGIGMQGHWNIYSFSEENLRASIERFASLGLQIQITELDISVYPSESGRRSKRDDENDQFTPAKEQKQIEVYDQIFKVLREYKDVITSVTFWNVSDRHSWLDNFPVRGRKNYPLLFDEENQPKKAFYEVVNF